jgi:hypothetical protein
MPDLKSEDLGKGYTLSFQQNPTTKQVRAVVKAQDGSIAVRGPVVDADKFEVSRRAAALEYATKILQPPPERFEDVDDEADDSGDEDAEGD